MGPLFNSALDAGGPQAAEIARLWWLFFGTMAVIFVVVLSTFVVAILRAPASTAPSNAHTSESRERTLHHAVGIALAVTVLMLFVYLISSVRTGRVLASLDPSNGLTVSVIGHQWWWEVIYENDVQALRVVTANEIHIPTGRPVTFNFTSRDVIHSFWAPSLHGKRDLIPGRQTMERVVADRPGIYRGQCAEFCGRQHAHMSFDVVAQPEDEFDGWLRGQREPARTAQTDQERRGEQIFNEGPCLACHTIRGSLANGQVGPDLTHVGSRARIGSDVLDNVPRLLGHWVTAPQNVKPGNQMPDQRQLSDAEQQALVAYLMALK